MKIATYETRNRYDNRESTTFRSWKTYIGPLLNSRSEDMGNQNASQTCCLILLRKRHWGSNFEVAENFFGLATQDVPTDYDIWQASDAPPNPTPWNWYDCVVCFTACNKTTPRKSLTESEIGCAAMFVNWGFLNQYDVNKYKTLLHTIQTTQPFAWRLHDDALFYT